MKRFFMPLVAIALLSGACQTSTELTDQEKETMVQSVKKVSEEFVKTIGQVYTEESVANSITYFI